MQTKAQAGAGYGQGSVGNADSVTRVVRVRTGVTVQRGEYLGARGNATAFVWKEEVSVVPDREIIVRVGREGAWLWEGNSRIDVRTAFPGNQDAARMVRPFEDWQRFFEKYYDARRPQRFFWGRYHQEGLSLARRLQAVLIDLAIVRYQRPPEDPGAHEMAGIDL
ncbi:MAG: hypothetical protein JNJ67_07810 [Chromatiales bacterium]|nr:hypothetical protein [Chromatiales bacterium]